MKSNRRDGRGKVKFVFLSDVHGDLRSYSDQKIFCDFFFFCGDFLEKGCDVYKKTTQFADWLVKKVICKKRFLVLGNHDMVDPYKLGERLRTEYNSKIILLHHDEYVIDMYKFFKRDVKKISPKYRYIKIFGTPLTKSFSDEDAFSKSKLEKRDFEDIPKDTNILLSHIPPKKILDLAGGRISGIKSNWGSYHLLERVRGMRDLFVHAFGHAHIYRRKIQCRVVEKYHKNENLSFVNCSVVAVCCKMDLSKTEIRREFYIPHFLRRR